MIIIQLVQALLFCIYILGANGQGTVHILEEPITNYIMTGSNATFHCKTFAHEVYWRLNGTLLTELDWPKYRPEFQFNKKLSANPFFYNLSLMITGTEQTNLTTIACDTYIGSARETSDTATLYVFNTFPPPPTPLITLQATNGNVQVDLFSPYRWLDFESSYYNISLSTAHFSQIVSELVTVKKNISLFIGQNDFITYSIEPCLEYLFEITIVSPVFGLSQPFMLEFISPPSQMAEIAMSDVSIYFNSFGKPFLTLYAEVNKTCPLLNYTYTIHLSGTDNNNSFKIGPKDMSATGIVHEILVPGLEMNKKYTAQLEVTTIIFRIGNSIASSTHMIETSMNKLQGPSCAPPELGELRLKTDEDLYVTVVLGILCGILGLLLTPFVIVCICVLLKRNPNCRKTRQSSDAMIENPIYSGPVYETVPQGYNPLCSSASTTPDSSPTTPLNGNIQYTANPTSRTDIIDLVRKNALPTQPNDRILSPLAGTSYRSSSLSGNSTVKRPHSERNKLHLTLSLGRSHKEADQNGTEKDGAKKSGSGSGGPLSEEDANYTVMSPAVSRTFGSSLNGGWGETNPEVTSKYKE